jgi:hypothetical protein
MKYFPKTSAGYRWYAEWLRMMSGALMILSLAGKDGTISSAIAAFALMFFSDLVFRISESKKDLESSSKKKNTKCM